MAAAFQAVTSLKGVTHVMGPLAMGFAVRPGDAARAS
jgi:hypothetical protein